MRSIQFVFWVSCLGAPWSAAQETLYRVFPTSQGWGSVQSLAPAGPDEHGRNRLVHGGGGRVDLYSGAGRDNAAPRRIFSVGGPDGHDFGLSVDGAADVDQDGIDDVLVGAPRAGALAGGGLVRVLSGRNGQTLLEYPGDGRAFGRSVSFVGDVDRDGVPDLAVGSTDEQGSAGPVGAVRVYSGDPAAKRLLLARRSRERSFGFTVDSLGDVDADGLPDLLVAAPGGGKVHLLRVTQSASGQPLPYLARNARTFDVLREPERLAPQCAAAVGDIDLDGATEVAVPIGPSQVDVFSAVSGARLRHIQVPDLYPPSRPDLVLSGAGDYDDDGVLDLAVGQPYRPASRFPDCLPLNDFYWCDGGAFVFDGWTGEQLAFLPGTGDLQGWTLAGIGDANGDGRSDVAMGSCTYFYRERAQNMPGPGCVTVVTKQASTRSSLTILGDIQEDRFGWDVAGGKDMSRDGLPDIAVSSLRRQGTSAFDVTFTGRVQAYRGVSGKKVLEIEGRAAGDHFGFSIALLEDVDGDSVAELIVGAPGASRAGALECGRVYVLSGASGDELYRVEGDLVDDALGMSVAVIGDCNADGIEDWIAGAPGCLTISPLVYCENPHGYARVYSGEDGAVIWTLRSATGVDYGRAVDAGGLVDSDVVPDLLVSSPRESLQAFPYSLGALYLYSGATGALIRTLHGPHGNDPGEQFGMAAGFAGDLDGDGRDEVFAAGNYRQGATSIIGYCSVYDAGSGSIIEQWSGGADYRAIAGIGYSFSKLRGSGSPDHLFYSYPGAFFDSSERSGALMRYREGEALQNELVETGISDWDYYGYSIAAAGDVDGDGKGDLVVGIPTDPDALEGQQAGWNRVVILLDPLRSAGPLAPTAR